MDEIIIYRCVKRPGMFVGGRTYRIIYNDKGLYLICLGKATNEVPKTDLVSILAADKIVNAIANQYEKKIQATEARLKTGSLDEIAKEKQNYFLPKDKIALFDAKKNFDATYKVKIKGEGVNIALLAHEGYGHQIETIQQLIKK